MLDLAFRYSTEDGDDRITYSFSPVYLLGAVHLASRAYSIERESDPSPGIDAEHRTAVTGSILFSVAFLEAQINELYTDCADHYPPNLLEDDPPGVRAAKTLKLLWEAGTERATPTQKYQQALWAAGSPMLDTGAEPFQSAEILIALRNALMHYKPEHLSLHRPHRFERKLRGKFVPRRHYTAADGPYYPDGCLGYGCAKWAVQSALSFSEEFWKRLNGEPLYRHFCNHELDLPAPTWGDASDHHS